MEYTFILDESARVERIEEILRVVNGITWRIDNKNLRVDVPDRLLLSVEDQILAAVAAGNRESPERLIDAYKADAANILCGALQSKLLDKYLPVALRSLPKGIVVEVDSIDDKLVMLRMRGPKESIDVVDRISALIMSKCAVGVSDDE
jgi:hypothetical protein